MDFFTLTAWLHVLPYTSYAFWPIRIKKIVWWNKYKCTYSASQEQEDMGVSSTESGWGGFPSTDPEVRSWYVCKRGPNCSYLNIALWNMTEAKVQNVHRRLEKA